MNITLQTFCRITFILWFLAIISPGQAQDDLESQIASLTEQVESLKPGTSRFLLRGYSHVGYEYREANTYSNFVVGSFNPLFIYRQSDRVLFESELEFGFEGSGEVEVGFEYANIAYRLTNTITVRAGKFLVPFGIFGDRLHPAWINKLPTAPLAYGHDGILPRSDVGIELRGGAYAGNTKYNFSFYLANGPGLNDGSEHPDDAGKLNYGQVFDNNNSKTVGGRIGIFPFSNSSVELGLSGQYGKVGDRGTVYEDVAATLTAIDLGYVQSFPSLKGVIDFKGQINWVNIGDADYIDQSDTTGLSTYTFENKSLASFAQLAWRLSYVSSPIIQKMELVGRYSNFQAPEGSRWATRDTKWDLGLNYWLDWRTVIKVSYSIGTSLQGDEKGEIGIEEPSQDNAFFVHFAIGF